MKVRPPTHFHRSSADSPVITIEGAGFGSVPTANPPGCAFIPNNGFDYGSDLALYDFNASHSFYAGGGSSCIGFVNLSYSDTQISYQFGPVLRKLLCHAK